MPPLFRIVSSAITSLRSRLQPASGGDGTGSGADGGLMGLPFTHRAAFNQQMNEQLDDSSQVLDDLDAKLRKLRTHVVNLRNQLAASQNATESTWEQVRAGFSKEHGELHDGVRHARPWAASTPADRH
jgi:hypothetical protein